MKNEMRPKMSGLTLVTAITAGVLALAGVPFAHSDGETPDSSASVEWNVGEIQWLETSYHGAGPGVVRLEDPDLNLDPESVDHFDIHVYSDSNVRGVDLVVTETGKSTGIFEGSVTFARGYGSDHRLTVEGGDTIYAVYVDETLPYPEFDSSDEKYIKATSIIDPPLPYVRAPAPYLKLTDSSADILSIVEVGQYTNIVADLTSYPSIVQQGYTYIVHIRDSDGVTVKLDWIDSTIDPERSSMPSVSWTPQTADQYLVKTFVWESMNNPVALLPALELQVTID